MIWLNPCRGELRTASLVPILCNPVCCVQGDVPQLWYFFFSSQVSVFTTRTVKHWEHWAGNSTVIYHRMLSSVGLSYRREGIAMISQRRKSSQVYVKRGGRRQHEPGNPKSQSSRGGSQNLGDFRAKILPLGDFRNLDCRGQCGMRKWILNRLAFNSIERRTGSAQVWNRSPVYYHGFQFSAFRGFLSVQMSGSLFPVICPGLFSFCLFSPIPKCYLLFYLIRVSLRSLFGF